jgi:hypothetical protein
MPTKWKFLQAPRFIIRAKKLIDSASRITDNLWAAFRRGQRLRASAVAALELPQEPAKLLLRRRPHPGVNILQRHLLLRTLERKEPSG